MTISHVTLQRLSFAKYLYYNACEQSRSAELLAAASLLMFHDALEMFLQISAEHLDIGSNHPNFMTIGTYSLPSWRGSLFRKRRA